MKKLSKKSRAKRPISDGIRKCIADRGLTAYAAAKKANVSVDAIQRFINNERGMNLSTADKIAESLHLKICDSSDN